MKNTAQNRPPTAQKIAALPAENARERKKRIGSIGAGARSSPRHEGGQQDDRRRRSVTSTSGLAQPAALPRTSAQTMPSTPPLTSARPGRSSAVSGPWLSGMPASTSGISARPIGTFSQKIHSQAMPSVTTPPTSGPPATARPLTAKKMPSAPPRRSGGKAGETSVSASVVTSGGADALHRAGGDQRADRSAPPRTPPMPPRTGRCRRRTRAGGRSRSPTRGGGHRAAPRS